ncbi:MAG: fumarate hydratase C-terminal domain-containing protein [Chloroflexi bacterium]|nr:fumarate hydratase C-terminal domain-containing protein [Chloroflexota bacterium]
METLRPREWHLKAPLSQGDNGKLRPGDIVYLTGPTYTARDGAYRRMLVEGHEPPVDLRGLTNVTMQSSPAGVEVAPGVYHVSSLQATAGFRYAQYMPALLERFGVKAVISKAGMTDEVRQRVFRHHGAVSLSTVGYGLGAIYGRAIERVLGVYWVEELGISEAIWVLQVKELGPLLVEGDAEGNGFFAQANEEINERLAQVYQGLKPPVFRRIGEEQGPKREPF